MTRPGRRAFTLVEMLVAVGILTVLFSIFIPYALSMREAAHRVACADNLRQVGKALYTYAQANRTAYPRVVYDDRAASPWTVFTGPDCDDPFLDNAAVRPNDVTASLWLLVRTRHLSPKLFICPSTADVPDALHDVAGKPVDPERRGNFRGPENLSYSYASPFSAAPGFRFDSDNLKSDFVLLADRNPGKSHGQNVESVHSGDAPLKLAYGNSLNHRRAGQNVLYAPAGNVAFVTTPFSGAGRTEKTTGDNIYTALRRTPLTGERVPANEPGSLGDDCTPAWDNDAYLLPYDR